MDSPHEVPSGESADEVSLELLPTQPIDIATLLRT